MTEQSVAPGVLGGEPGSDEKTRNARSIASWARAENLTALRELNEQASTLSRAASADGGAHFNRSHVFPLWRAVQDQLEGLQAQIVAEFAAERGWQRAGRVFTLAQLRAGRPGRTFPYDYAERAAGVSSVLDHPDFFRDPARPNRPAAVATHLYADSDAACRAFAEKYGLQFERLPWSWYSPERCIAGLFYLASSESSG